ncbi:MAG TPA: helix-turn-helix domain-containing protein [Bacteroidia bacterium]|jgi:AraC-like DNA-binding protein|nr:helix-turn-helix domain-containing protein [Bacteroidia bacterium]
MHVEVYPPAELLKPFILTYLIIESEDKLVNNILPDTSLVMAFRYKGQMSYVANEVKNELPSSSLSGLRKSSRQFLYSKNTGNLLVLFKEGGAGAFFKTPLHQLFEACVSLEHFIDKSVLGKIEEQLSEARTNTQRIKFLEMFLMAELRDLKSDPVIQVALQKIHAARGLIRIKDLADGLCLSSDAFEKRFRRSIGTSPKQFCSLVRIKSITNGKLQNQNLAALALEAGYFDQAQFNKDFKLFTGQKPSVFFKSSPFLKITDFLQ